MDIKTLAEILAESDNDSASAVTSKSKKSSQKPLSRSERFSYKSKSQRDINANPPTEQGIHSHVSTEDTAELNNPFTAKPLNHKKPFTRHPPYNIGQTSSKKKKRFHPAATFTIEPSEASAYRPPEAQSIKQMLLEVKHGIDKDKKQNFSSTSDTLTKDSASLAIDMHAVPSAYKDTSEAALIDNLPSALKSYLRTPEQKQADIDTIKAESRLRWLAFYYLSRREYGKAELKQKLLDKEQDAASIDALLDEFEQKGYQSDYRTTLMLIRENIRKGRGRERIKQEFYRKKITMPSNIDELIDMANTESDEFSEFVNDDDSLVEGVDWLKLAVAARTKKYGDDIPIEQKDKARQVRFLQYRGFKANICFEALNYTLDNLEDRF